MGVKSKFDCSFYTVNSYRVDFRLCFDLKSSIIFKREGNYDRQ